MNISSWGVLFVAPHPPPGNTSIHVIVDWPVRQAGIPVELIMCGSVIRSDGCGTAVRVERGWLETRSRDALRLGAK